MLLARKVGEFMGRNRTKDYYLKRLKAVLKELNAEQYPEMRDSIMTAIECFEDYGLFNIALEIQESDISKKMPLCVTELLEQMYLEITNSESVSDETAGLSYNNLGILYYDGRGYEKDYSKCIEYLEKADQLGCKLAAENLGFCYYYGLPDYEKAYKYFIKGALYGGHESMMKLGDMYRNGQYVEKDEDMVRICYYKALELTGETLGATISRHGSVYERLGDLYYEGIGVDVDYDQAFKLYQVALRGLVNQISSGDPWSSGHLNKVRDRLAILQDKITSQLPRFEYS